MLRDFLQQWKVECRADGLVPMRFAIFPIHLSKVLRLRRKSDAGSCEVLHPSRKIISANLKIWCSKMQPLSGNQRPNLLSDEHVSCTAPATENASLQILVKCPMPAIIFRNATKPSRFAHFWQGAQSLASATRNEIWTSKSGPYMVCFVHFDFEMCFAPQRRALFRHLNFQKWSVHGVFFTLLTSKCASRHNGVHFFDTATSKSAPNVRWFFAFSLANALGATTACNFSSLIWPHGSAPAALASLLFDPPEPQITEKNSVSRLSYLFAHLDLLSSETVSFWSSFFSSLLLLFPSLLSSVHMVGNLTSKLPSIILCIYLYICITVHVMFRYTFP